MLSEPAMRRGAGSVEAGDGWDCGVTWLELFLERRSEKSIDAPGEAEFWGGGPQFPHDFALH